MNRIRYILTVILLMMSTMPQAGIRQKYNFNSDWLLKVGDVADAKKTNCTETDWKAVTLPHAFNEDEAFKLDIRELTDTIMWYRKHFILPASTKGQKVFIEFEGARQGPLCKW